MVREKLILVPSKQMDANKKKDRNENGLVRMSKAARDYMSLNEDKVELYPNTNEIEHRLNNSILLSIFQAFSGDLKKLKDEGFTSEELCRVGFVTTKTYKKITGSETTKNDNIWITNSVTDTIIGADPEFLLFNAEGAIVRANNVMGYEGLVGSDGAMAELRPKPVITPEGLVDNIQSLFQDENLTKNIKDFDWIAGCYYKDNLRDYPVGGHIHIGNPIQVASINPTERNRFFQSFNKILDELLSIPMIKLDGKTLGKARRVGCSMGNYGYFGEFRLCNGRLEHRTLSGMWLVHPTITKAVIGTAKAIIDEVFRYAAENKFDQDYLFPSKYKDFNVWSTDFDKWDDIPICKDLNCVETSKVMVELLHGSMADKITLKFLKGWYEKITKLTTYKEYYKYIDSLYEILKINSKTLLECDKNIKSGWLEGKPFLS